MDYNVTYFSILGIMHSRQEDWLPFIINIILFDQILHYWCNLLVSVKKAKAQKRPSSLDTKKKTFIFQKIFS